MKIKLTILALLMPLLAFAQYIGEKEARDIAAAALKDNAVKAMRKAPKADAQGRYTIEEPRIELHRVVRSTSNDKPCFYIYNQRGSCEGFAIVSNQGQLLARSDRGVMDYDKAPENVKWLLTQYQQILSKTYSDPYPQVGAGSVADGVAEGFPSLYRFSIEPIIGCAWLQGEPFCTKIYEKYIESGMAKPKKGIPAGCSTIAMGQTMFFWKHPQRGTGTKKWKVGKKEYDVNFEETIDWEHIKATAKESYGEALSNLCFNLAAAIDAEPGDGATNAGSMDIVNALKNIYDYDKSIKFDYFESSEPQTFEELVYSELRLNRPVIIAGKRKKTQAEIEANPNSKSKYIGHQMVVEGYDAETNQFFINMGWGSGGTEQWGPYNAYYALCVDNKYFTYTIFQDIITHIKPNSGGQATPQIVGRRFAPANAPRQTKARRVVEYDKAEGAKTYHVQAEIFSNDMDADIVTGILAKDFVTGKECVFEGSTHHLQQNYIQNMTFDIDLSQIQYNGYYMLRPVFRLADGDEWFIIQIMKENEEQEEYQPDYVDVSNAETLDLGIEIDFKLEQTTIELGDSAKIDYGLPIPGVPVTFTSSEPDIASVDDKGTITAHMAGEVTITAHCDDYTFNGNRLVKETNKEFRILCQETVVNHQVQLNYFFPKVLECSLNDGSYTDIIIQNNITIAPEFDKPGYSQHIEYVLGFFRDGKLVKRGYSLQGEYMSYNRTCQYSSRELLEWHSDLIDGEYELKLLYRIPDETPEGTYWVMPTRREGEAKVYMKLENGKATFRQVNRHPCELKVDAIHFSTNKEVGMQNTITVDVTRTTGLDDNVCSDVFCYIDGQYIGHEMLDMQSEQSKSYLVKDFGYTYYFTPQHAGPYNIKIIDGKHHILHNEDIQVGEGKNYQLRVNDVVFHNSFVPNKVNNEVQIELEIENNGEYRYTGDVVCRPVPKSGVEDAFLPPRFQLDIAPGVIVRQILPMNFDFYFSLDDTEYIIVKCYYTSNGKDTILWKSEELTYIDPIVTDCRDSKDTLPHLNQDIYNLQGVAVGKMAHFDQLPAGLYIIEGNKILKK